MQQKQNEISTLKQFETFLALKKLSTTNQNFQKKLLQKFLRGLLKEGHIDMSFRRKNDKESKFLDKNKSQFRFVSKYLT